MTTVAFSRNQKYLLSAGKDAVLRVWELSTGRQMQNIVTGHQLVSAALCYGGDMYTFSVLTNCALFYFCMVQRNRLRVTFSYNEDFIISSDEQSYACQVWDSRTGEMVQRLTGHTNIVECIVSSPIEPAIITCRYLIFMQDKRTCCCC